MSQPGFFFYTGDWLKDTRSLSLEARGAWIDLICALHEAGGSVTWPLRAYDQYLGTVEHNGIVYSAREILDELKAQNICSIVTEANGKVTVTSRRLAREANSSESNRKRQERFRGKQRSNASVTRTYNASSSSSSSSSPKSLKKDPEPATPGPVDKSKKKEAENEPTEGVTIRKEPVVQFESKKFTERAKRICGSTPDHLSKLVEWVISMKTAMPTEPMERINAVVGLCLDALERHIEAGRPIHSLWGLLTTIFDSERTKYMQGAENEGHKSGPIAGEVRDIMRGIG